MSLSTRPPLDMLRELRDAIVDCGPEAQLGGIRDELAQAEAALDGQGDAVAALMALHQAASMGLSAQYLEERRLGRAMAESAEVLVANGSGYPEWREYFASRGEGAPAP